MRARASADWTACVIAASRPGRSDTKRSINSSISESLPGNEPRRRLIRGRLIVPSSGAVSDAARGLLLFTRSTVAPHGGGFVTQPTHEGIQRRAADAEAARGLGPIALGLGERKRDSLASGLVEIFA